LALATWWVGNQVQFVLDDEFRRQPTGRQGMAGTGFAGTVEAVVVVAFHPAEQGADCAGPRQGGEFIDGGNQESGQPAVDRFVDADDRQGAPGMAGEVAAAVDAHHPQVGRIVVIRPQTATIFSIPIFAF
jgi:hypothetical protein